MISNYQGHYFFDSFNVSSMAPNCIGVYYCGYIAQNNQLIPLYIGRAQGPQVSIKSRLYDHLREDTDWKNVTHFGFKYCDTPAEAIALEDQEIKMFQPPYNVQSKKIV